MANDFNTENLVNIKVVGVGGGGGNAVNRMIELDSDGKGVEYINVNTDAHILVKSAAPNKISIIPMMIKEIFNSFICSEYIIPISDRMIANMVTTNWGITISGPTPITGKCFCLFSVSFKLQFLLTISSFRSVPISLKDWNCTTTTYL